jgi:tripartite-type tricarboxylate transporter receptor subunit TctC
MMLSRRTFVHVAAGAGALAASSVTWPGAGRAADYPTRPPHLIVGFPAGSGPDVIARLAAHWLTTRLGQEVIVDNRPGAGGNIATEVAAKAAPDGYTLLLAVSANTINATLYEHLNFDFAHDFVGAGMVAVTPFVFVSNPDFEAKTLAELIALAKQKPGAINMASSGVGSGSHVAGELLQMMAGIKLTHVPYRNNYVPDLLSGQIPLAVSPLPQVLELIKAGKLRGLGVTPAKRSQTLPDVPSVGEIVPGYEATGWFAICVPTGTPAEIVARLDKELSAGVGDADLRNRLVGAGAEPRAMTSAELTKFMADETAKYRQVIKFANIKPM